MGIIYQLPRGIKDIPEVFDITYNFIPIYFYGITHFDDKKTSPGLFCQLGANFLIASKNYRTMQTNSGNFLLSTKGGLYFNIGAHIKLNDKGFIMAGYQSNGGSLTYNNEDIINIKNSGFTIRGGVYLDK